MLFNRNKWVYLRVACVTAIRQCTFIVKWIGGVGYGDYSSSQAVHKLMWYCCEISTVGSLDNKMQWRWSDLLLPRHFAGPLYPAWEGYGLVRKTVRSRNKNSLKSRKDDLSGVVRAEKRQPKWHGLHIRLTKRRMGKLAFCANGKQKKNGVMLQKTLLLYIKNSIKLKKKRWPTRSWSLCYWNYERTEIARNRTQRSSGPINYLDVSRATSTTVGLPLHLPKPDFQMTKLSQPMKWGVEGVFSDGVYSSLLSPCVALAENFRSRLAIHSDGVLHSKMKSWFQIRMLIILRTICERFS